MQCHELLAMPCLALCHLPFLSLVLQKPGHAAAVPGDAESASDGCFTPLPAALDAIKANCSAGEQALQHIIPQQHMLLPLVACCPAARKWQEAWAAAAHFGLSVESWPRTSSCAC
jgi:hypothetical protein